MTYLIDNPPRVQQFRPRRDTPTGLIVVHTAESFPDETGPDTGTLAVARFIENRATPGCYHALADSDSRLQLVPYALATYGDGTGSNEIAIHVSAATQAAKWSSLPEAWVDGCVRQLAAAAADAARWLKATHGITVPAKRIDKAASDARQPGFIAHAQRDPGRRTDPGAGFPWSDFLDLFADMTLPEDNAPKPRTQVERGRRRLQDALQSAEARHLDDRARMIRRALRELPER
jgi:hypothetical protein